MAETRQKEMTAGEFYRWCLDQEERFELVDGFPVPLRAMSGASTTHDQIVVNVIAALKQMLRGTGCRPTTADVALRTGIKRSRRPYVMIECAHPTPRPTRRASRWPCSRYCRRRRAKSIAAQRPWR